MLACVAVPQGAAQAPQFARSWVVSTQVALQQERPGAQAWLMAQPGAHTWFAEQSVPGPQSSSKAQATQSPVGRSQCGVAGWSAQSSSRAQPLAPPLPEAEVEPAVVDEAEEVVVLDDEAVSPALVLVAAPPPAAVPAPAPVDEPASTISMLPHAAVSAASEPARIAARTKCTPIQAVSVSRGGKSTSGAPTR
jgi:hypothetical protein